MKTIQPLVIATIISLLFAGCNITKQTNNLTHKLPHFKKTNGVTQLYVDNEPFIILGGELRNSSASSREFMQPIWPRMANLNINTIILPITWRQFEAAEGEYDYSLLEAHIKDARKHNIRLIFLWFGAWKNGMSGYCPEWVTGNPEHFPRMEHRNGKKVEVLSNLSENLLKSEQAAFYKLMKRIAEIDSLQNTVIMMQVENEVGLLGDTRDFSAMANEHFTGQVPGELISYLQTNKDILQPVVANAWAANGNKTSGTWSEVFGDGIMAEEIFMAWSYSSYINKIAQAGKEAYDIPMFVNVWLHTEGRVPGIYPSGGPVATMLDIWDAGAPDLALFAPDIYEPEFKLKCSQFVHNGNPLFIPEACAIWYDDTISAPAKAYYSIAKHNAIGFAPFGIDDVTYHANHPVKQAYATLNSMMPLIIDGQQNGTLYGFMEEGNDSDTILISNYQFIIDYTYEKPDYVIGYGLILQLSENEFIISGNGMVVTVFSTNPEKPNLSFLSIDEGEFVDGEWTKMRALSGDETINNGVEGLKFPPNPYNIGRVTQNDISVQKTKLFTF